MNNINWELLINYVNGDCTEDEMEQVQHWRAEQTENHYLLTYLERKHAQLQQPLKQSDIEEQWLRLLTRMFPTDQPVAKNQFLKSYRFIGLAASLLLFSVLGWLYFKSVTANNYLQVVQTSVNSRKTVTLPDGTQVFMAPDSKIAFNNFSGKKREVSLSGEAFFKVRHNADHPFVIYTADHLSVTVLGTSFNVYSRNNLATEIKVATGLVGVNADHHVNYVKAGQQFVYDPNTHHTETKSVLIKEASALQNSTLVFNRSNAAEIAEKIQRWYGIQVKVLPTAQKAPRFSGEMKDTGIANFLEGLSFATGMHYRFENPKTLLLF
ncbi:MAG: hypothetical protein JWR50_2320 [Mucilaginibacter sp.]|nr:hypothetical protein [Mucilaginibacter sp.]